MQHDTLRVRNILVPTDFSECSKKAVVYAANIARWHDSKLTLLHIIPPRPPLMAGHPDYDMSRSEALEQLKSLHAELSAQGILSNLTVSTSVRRGKGWDAIARVVQRDGIDVIVLGTNGRTGLKKLILGSFAEQVFRNSPCPVVTVGPCVDDRMASEYPKHILFPTDGSFASKAAEPYAYRLGRQPGTKLTLLGVVHATSAVDEELKRTLERLQATRLYAAWREGGTTPEVLADVGPTVKATLAWASRTLAELVVLGISEEGGDKLSWADAYQIVCSAACPVLSIRNTFPDTYFKRLMQMDPPQSRLRSNVA